jgi:hypothetical protein
MTSRKWVSCLLSTIVIPIKIIVNNFNPDILQSGRDSDNGWETGGGGNGGDDGGWGGGEAGWSGDHYEEGQRGGNSEMDDDWEESHEAPNQGWVSAGQTLYPPIQMPSAPLGSPPPLPAPPPVLPSQDETSATKPVTRHSENLGTESGGHQSTGQQYWGGQPQTQPRHSSSAPHANLAAAAAMPHRTVHTVSSSTGGVKVESGHGHDSRAAKGGPYWGPPSGQADASRAQKTAPRSALKAAGGTGLAQANTPWGQPKNTDPWGDPRAVAPRDPRHQYPASSHGIAHRQTQAWESWGKPAGWAKTTYNDDEVESSEETVGGWGAASAWDANYQREDEWGRQPGARKQTKVTFAPSSAGGTQNVLSPQQHSQILSSLLNLSTQSHNANTKSGSHGQQSMPYPQHQKQTQHHHPQSHPLKHKHEQVHQHHQHQYPEQFQDQGGKKSKKAKQKDKQKQPKAWGAEWDGRGDDGDNNAGWVGDDSWGNDGWDETNDAWGAATGGDAWGDSTGGGGWGGESHDGWGTGGGNDGWGEAGGSKDAWGNEAGSHDQWGQGSGTKKEKGKGKGKANWDAIEEEDSDADDWGVPQRRHKKAQKSIWGSSQAETPYTMPSKTLAHAYKGTTTSLNNGVDRNKIKEYADVHFIESKGAALLPVQNALFGRKLRMAKDRIHWLFSPNKDPRVSTMLSWIQAMEHNMGAFGVRVYINFVQVSN